MILNRLEATSKLYPHFYNRNPQSNFMKHLKVINNQQLDLYHKLKTLDWARRLEKPIQVWKEQNTAMEYTMYFKVMIPNLKQVNLYKNAVVDKDEEIIKYDEKRSYPYEDNNELEYYSDDSLFFSKSWKDTTQTDLSDEDIANYHNKYHIIPRDYFLIEVITWDDYRFLKGFPENDYIDYNELEYRYNESYLNIEVEEISYSKYLTFRVHIDKIKLIEIFKNDEHIYIEDFILEDFRNKGQLYAKDFSYKFYDYDSYKEYLKNRDIYEVEDEKYNPQTIYRADTEKDEYVYRLLLTDDDFDENGVLKDTYDFYVTTFKHTGFCSQDREKTYRKRYNGYDSLRSDCFDHDYSLDMIGHLFGVERFKFDKVPLKNIYYYSRTYPSFNDRFTEDDYHYMKRIQRYIQEYNKTWFPVLEFWKYYYTNSELVNRKKYLGEQDNSYLRTNEIDTCLLDVGETLIEEEFDDDAKIIEYNGDNLVEYDLTSITTEGTNIHYHINKATNVTGESHHVTIDDAEWEESVIVNKVYIVPSSTYRLRYGVKDNQQPINIRLEYYDKDNRLISSSQFIPEDYGLDDTYYPHTENYDYEDILITTPSDGVSMMIVLESENTFKFTDVTLQKQTIIDWDNKYIKTSYECNSNIYDLYVNYHEIPSNLHLFSTDQFELLFNRSLPLTKQGSFHIYLDEGTFDTLEVEDEIIVEINDYFGEDKTKHTGNNHYEFDILYDFINDLYQYRFEFTCKNNNPSWAEERTPTFLVNSYIVFKDNYGQEIGRYECEEEIDTKIDGTVIFTCKPPVNQETPVNNATWHIESTQNFSVWDMHLTRKLIEET